MKYLVAIFFPFVSFFYIKKPVSGYCAFIIHILAFLGVSIYHSLTLLLVVWLLLILWAFFEISDFNAKEIIMRFIRNPGASDSNSDGNYVDDVQNNDRYNSEYSTGYRNDDYSFDDRSGAGSRYDPVDNRYSDTGGYSDTGRYAASSYNTRRYDSADSNYGRRTSSFQNDRRQPYYYQNSDNREAYRGINRDNYDESFDRDYRINDRRQLPYNASPSRDNYDRYGGIEDSSNYRGSSYSSLINRPRYSGSQGRGYTPPTLRKLPYNPPTLPSSYSVKNRSGFSNNEMLPQSQYSVRPAGLNNYRM